MNFLIKLVTGCLRIRGRRSMRAMAITPLTAGFLVLSGQDAPAVVLTFDDIGVQNNCVTVGTYQGFVFNETLCHIDLVESYWTYGAHSGDFAVLNNYGGAGEITKDGGGTFVFSGLWAKHWSTATESGGAVSLTGFLRGFLNGSMIWSVSTGLNGSYQFFEGQEGAIDTLRMDFGNHFLVDDIEFDVGPVLEELELSSSAIPMNLAIGQIGSDVHHQAVRGINNRLFRARARTTAGNLKRFPVSLRQSSGFPSAQSSANAASPDTVAAGDNWEYFVSGSFGDVGLDNLGANPGLDSSTYNSTVGFEYKVSDPFSVGLGWSHVWNDNDMNGGLGSVDMDGDAAIVYATWFKNNVWADLLYGYGAYEADIRRPNGGGTSVASPDLTAHQLSLNVGYNIEADTANTWLAPLTAGNSRLVYGPTLGVDYSTGTLDGYAETGSPGFDAVFGDQDFDSLIARVGGQVTHSTRINWGRFQSQLRLEYAHESQDQGNTVRGSLVVDPLITATGTDLAAGRDWLEAGAGVSLDVVDSDVTVYLDYTGQFFRSDMTSSYFTLGARMRF